MDEETTMPEGVEVETPAEEMPMSDETTAEAMPEEKTEEAI